MWNRVKLFEKGIELFDGKRGREKESEGGERENNHSFKIWRGLKIERKFLKKEYMH